MPYMDSEDFPENTEQVWEEHFLFLRKRAESRQAAAVILHIGGPYEGSPSDKVPQAEISKFAIVNVRVAQVRL